MTGLLVLAALTIAAPATPAVPAPVVSASPEAQLSAAQRENYRAVFAAIRAGRRPEAQALLSAMPEGPLHGVAKAELWLKPGARPDGPSLAAWLDVNARLPQAAKVAALARSAGVSGLAPLPAQQPLLIRANFSGEKPRSTKSDAAYQGVSDGIRPLIAQDQPIEAEAMIRAQLSVLTGDARDEALQRVAWSYYLTGDDANALRLGAESGQGLGEWAAMGDWVAGLAAFRADDCARAAQAFERVPGRTRSADLAAAAYFWAARADTACMRPERVSARLRNAARYTESFYGLLARRSLGLQAAADLRRPSYIRADWNHVASEPAARRAAALAEVGELGLADRELRHLAEIGDPANHIALLSVAARLNLPATQVWLAQHAPAGVAPPAGARFPAPAWLPARGWRVEKSLVFAHALQESGFITDAVSRAGARGVMQLMPATAKKIAANMTGAAVPDLADPEFNIECGQSYLEELRDSPWTSGLLPKVIAAYNAGPGSVKAWTGKVRDKGDPLLFLESIPFAETRHYVEVVLRNYWIYQLGDGKKPVSMDAMAQGMWPRFPGLPGATALRMAAPPPVQPTQIAAQ